MNGERLQILKMVQDGRISPEEASRLLEAVEAPGAARASGPKPTRILVKITEDGRSKSLSIGLGLARWVLHLVSGLGVDYAGMKIEKATLPALIESGAVGKIFEAEDGNQRVEVYLDQ